MPTVTVSNLAAEAEAQMEGVLSDRDRAESLEVEDELARIAEEHESVIDEREEEDG